MTKFVRSWVAGGLLISLGERYLIDNILLLLIALYVTWVAAGLLYIGWHLFRAWNPVLRRRSLRTAGYAALVGLGVVLLNRPLALLGGRISSQIRFKTERPYYERFIAELPEGTAPRGWQSGSVGEYIIDSGPPVRVAFLWPPGRFIDNWCGAIYDPTGVVMQANQFNGDWASWQEQVPWSVVYLFGGKMKGCHHLGGHYYRCCFT